MKDVIRIIAAVQLALVLFLGQVAFALAASPVRADDGTILICNGSGLVALSTGAPDSSDTPQLRLCPECLPGFAGLPVSTVLPPAEALAWTFVDWDLPETAHHVGCCQAGLHIRGPPINV